MCGQHGRSPQARPRAVTARSMSLDADERRDDAADAVDQQVAPQQRAGADRPVGTPLSASGISATMIRALKMIAERMALCGEARRMTLSAPELRVEGQEHRRDDGEILGHVVRDREGGERAAGHQQLLADLDDLDELGRVAVEVDHVAGLAGRLRAGVHRHADVGLGQRRRVVGAVAAHGDQLALRLLLADQRELGLRRGLGEEVVDARLGGDRGGGQRVVAGDHHRADAHPAQLGEALADAALDDVLEVDDAEQRPSAPPRAVCRPPARSARRWLDRAARADGGQLRQAVAPRRARDRTRIDRALADRLPSRSTPLMRVCAVNGTKRRVELAHVAAANAVLLLGQDHDRAALGGLVGERGELRRVGELAARRRPAPGRTRWPGGCRG